MTPLQLFLASLVVFCFILWYDWDGKAKDYIKTLGGFSMLSMIGSIIWAIFYYIKV